MWEGVAVSVRTCDFEGVKVRVRRWDADEVRELLSVGEALLDGLAEAVRSALAVRV